ncbi:hypothetical protein HPB52_013635 [Rhipicephalus sanguineus]|uniref:Uncharacterized protein n=1 Tax=Rhipicephalus sanguineus TaxID=34632 RepID=A0A9D4QB42_RHISA|nr:hypothetical protein HPB52_013635 [Rhipicephalus sanguineus]
MASAFLQPPAHFEPGDNPQQSWEDWKEAYNIYEQACEYATKPTTTRRALLLHALGPHGRRVAQTFPPPPPTIDCEQPTDQVTYLLEQFDALYRPYKNTEDANTQLPNRAYSQPAVPRAPLQAVHPAAMSEHLDEYRIQEWPAIHSGLPGAYNDPHFAANQDPGAYGLEPYGAYRDVTSSPMEEQLQRTYQKGRFHRAPSNEMYFTRACVLVAICLLNVSNVSDYRYRDPYHQTACVFHASADGLAISNDGVRFGLSRFPFALCRMVIFCCPSLGDNLEPEHTDDLMTEFASRALRNNPVVHTFMMLGDGSDADEAQFTALQSRLAADVVAPDVGKWYKAWSYTGLVLRWPETTSAATWHRMAPLLKKLAKQLASPSRDLSLGVALRQNSFGPDLERIAFNLGKTYLFLLPPAMENSNNGHTLRYFSQRTLGALDDLNLRFLSRSLTGRQCYLFPADTYTYRDSRST